MYGIEGLLAGRTLGERYRVDAVIGRGGMGAVYRATDERLGRAVAVKVIAASTSDPAEIERLRARFHREARAAASLHHPNVVDVYDFGADQALGLDYIVMELLRGEDLASRLNRGVRPTRRMALTVLREAARGLAAGHRAGLVHRDVKPGNLFLEEGDHPDEPRVRVLDFGIAQVVGDDGTVTRLTEHGRAPFSPAYASPEQFLGETRLSPSSDVFSLAAVGYQLLTGTRCFTADDPAKMMMEVSASVMAMDGRAPDLPGPLRQAIVRALSRKPADRFRDAAEFAEALGTRVGPSHAASSPSSPSRPASPPTQRTSVPAADETQLFTAAAAGPRHDATMAAVPDGTQLFAARTGTPPNPAVRSAPAPTYGSAPAPQPQPTRSGGPVGPPPPAFAAAPGMAQAPAFAPPQAPAAASGDALLEQARRRWRMKKLRRWLWETSVSLTVYAGFVGVWLLALYGAMNEQRDALVVGTALTVALTPAAIHRLTDRRGRPWLLFGVSLAGTAAARSALGAGTDNVFELAAYFGVQVILCWLAARIIPRRRHRSVEEDMA